MLGQHPACSGRLIKHVGKIESLLDVTIKVDIARHGATGGKGTRLQLIGTLAVITLVLLSTVDVLALPVVDIVVRALIAIVDVRDVNTRHGRTVKICETGLDGIDDDGKTGSRGHRRANSQVSRRLFFLLRLFLLVAIVGILGDGRLIATSTGKKTGSPQSDGGECAKCSATAQQHFVFELIHHASFLRSGYRAGTQHIVGRIKLEFIS